MEAIFITTKGRNFRSKSLVLVVFIILIFLTLSVAVAANSNTTDKGSASLVKKNTTTTAVKGAPAKTTTASYNTLQNELKTSKKNTLTLTKNYKYTGSDSVNGIVLNKNNMVIDGKGHTIDGSGKARVFVVNAKNVVLKNMIIKNGRSGLGSAIGFYKGATLSTVNVTFTNNYASNAGCIFVDNNCKYTSSRDKFIDCYSKTEGIITSNVGTVNINQGYFRSKYKLHKGFITSIGKSGIGITGSTFTNTKSKYSTAVFGDAYTSIKNTKFINLESEMTGGAIVLKEENKTLKIENCEFRNVTSTNNGGAIFVDVPGASKTIGTTTIVNTKFTNCRSKFGGAILQLGGKLNINKCTFNNNKAIYDGGAIYTSLASTTVTNSEFLNNKNLLTDGRGSAMYIDYGQLSLKNSKFTNNNGNGAIHLYDTNYNIVSNTFKSNKIAAYAVFSTGTFKSNKLNGDKTSLKNTYYPTVVSEDGIPISIKNPVKNVNKLPSRYDSRKMGYVTSVKNQGEKNSCWAFGANAAIESSLLKTTKKRYDLSENTVVSTRLQYSPFGEKGRAEYNSETAAIGHMVSWLGTYSQDYDPYDEFAKITELSSTEENIHIQDVLLILESSKNLKNEMKQAIYKYGAISGLIYGSADKKYYNAKKASYYSYGNEQQNHCIAIVGWDDNYSKYNFAKTPKGNGAWIVKNSYGTSFGDKGYMYVSYYDTSIYKRSKSAFIFTNTVQYNKNYQTDLLGMTDFLRPDKGNVIHYANSYNMTEDDYLAAVGTWFDRKGVPYNFRIVVNDKNVHQQSGYSPYSGYTTIKLTKMIPVKAKDQVQIIFKSNAVPVELYSRAHYQDDASLYSVNGKNWKYVSNFKATASLKLYTVDKRSIKKVSNTNVKKTKQGYSAVFYNGAGSALSNEEVKFVVNNKEYTSKTDEYGVAVLQKTFDDEKYTIEIINPETDEIYYDYLDFEDDDTYNIPHRIHHTGKKINKHITSYTPKITKTVTNTNTKVKTIIYDPHKYTSAKFLDNNGNILKNSKVKIIVDGVEYEKTTNEDGVAILDTLSVGKHTITLINEETGERITYEVEVKPSIIENHDLECGENDNATFKVKAVDENGNPVKAGETVTFKINDEAHEVKTDEQGYASLEIKEKPGNYNITATYHNYTTTNKLTVKG